MRGLVVILAAAAAWTLAGGTLPRIPAPTLPRVSARTATTALVVGGVAGALVLGVTATPSVAIALGVLSAAAPFAVAAVNDARRRVAALDHWPDFLATLRSHLASGTSLPEAFVAAGDRAGPELQAAAAEVAELALRGTAFADALERLKESFADPVADRVLATLAAAHSIGGSRVGAVLGALGQSVADELRLRKAHAAALTQQRMTAAVAMVAPWALLLLTVATNPQAGDAYATPTGSAIVVGGLSATLVGYLLARRVARLSQPPRLFR